LATGADEDDPDELSVNIALADLPVLSVAWTVCEPEDVEGTVNDALNVPLDDVVKDDGVVALGVPSYLTVTAEFAEKALPVTVTETPGNPLVGLRLIDGVEDGDPAGGQNDPDEHITAVMVVGEDTEIVLYRSVDPLSSQ
jgi:hypothetical protein